ncbi:hypothetical protein DRN97_08235 [Methanosarcinales archaeon]|nr:MAG: hypothetical protein DRN97_08235 [Methanosarcinales archaeon]
MDITANWFLDAEGVIKNTVIVETSTMIQADAQMFITALKFALPQIFRDILWRTSEKENVYFLTPQSTLTISDLKHAGLNIMFSSERFELEIPKVLEDEPLSPDDVVLTLTIVFPWNIDIANTTDVQGNKVTWRVTKRMLYKGTTLKALFLKP